MRRCFEVLLVEIRGPKDNKVSGRSRFRAQKNKLSPCHRSSHCTLTEIMRWFDMKSMLKKTSLKSEAKIKVKTTRVECRQGAVTVMEKDKRILHPDVTLSVTGWIKTLRQLMEWDHFSCNCWTVAFKLLCQKILTVKRWARMMIMWWTEC